MITYVNSVFVSNVGSVATDPAAIEKGQFIFWDIDADAPVSANTVRFKIGMGTGKTMKNDKGEFKGIKWSNIINVADIKGWAVAEYAEDTEDVVTIDFSGLDAALLNEFAKGGKRIIVRLTFKDLPTRFRKWTESYEYITASGDTKDSIAQAIVNMINKEAKRARVIASLNGSNKIKLEAMKYDDDESVDSINWYGKVRFNANIYYTDPAADGWESLNKHFPKGVVVEKEPGKTYQATAKLVRDREAQAMGYEGILNRGEGTWPIIKPAMETDLNGKYDAITLEFENMYRTADDLFRKTKQSVEIYTKRGTGSAVASKLAVLVDGKVDKTVE